MPKKKSALSDAANSRKGARQKRRDAKRHQTKAIDYEAKKDALEAFLRDPEAVAKTAAIVGPALDMIQGVLSRIVAPLLRAPKAPEAPTPSLLLSTSVASPNEARRQLDRALLCLGALQGDPEQVREVRSALMDLYQAQDDSEAKVARLTRKLDQAARSYEEALRREQDARRQDQEEAKNVHLEVVTDLHEERDALKAELAEIRELALCTVDGLNHQVPQAQQCEHEWCKAVRQLRTKLSKES